MFQRFSFALLALFSLLTNFVQIVPAFENSPAAEKAVFQLTAEPTIRIGLATNARSVSIATSDSQIVAASPEEPKKFLATNHLSVSARAYRPPSIEIYHFEIQNIETQAEAESLAKDVAAASGEKTLAQLNLNGTSWRVSIGEIKETIEEANEFKAELADKGFEDAVIVTGRKSQPSDDAVALSQQLKNTGKSEVRSLVKTTGASQPTTAPNAVIDPNLREVIVSGGAAASFTSFKPVAFGSTNERAVPVKLNGKAYRGKIEVFVNSRGTLTVVNVVSLEDYLLGVVPNELGLPQLEAQKAQAVAARTYAVANINGFGTQGFDLLPTVRSQVYRGVSSEGAMPTRAVMQTRGIVATYQGKPINALYTSTCGGRTENSGNIFDFDEPYLRGVECSLEEHRQFAPFTIKTQRIPAKLRDEQNVELVRLMSLLAVNNFQLSTAQLSDEWFEDSPNASEISNWLNNVAAKLGKTFPNVTKDTAKPGEFARVLAQMLYADAFADTLLSESDIEYQLAFDDAAEIPKDRRADLAILMRDGYFKIYPDLTIKPNKAFSRAQMLRVIEQIYAKKKFMPTLQSGATLPSENGNVLIKNGKSSRTLTVRPDVFLFRQFGDSFYQVRETALVGGENVRFQTDATGAVSYLEISPSAQTTVAEKMSPFTNWQVNLSPSAVGSRLSRFVRGIGSLYDVRIAQKGFSRRAVDLEIVGSNGTFHLKGGKIRSALRLNEQLFALNKRYDSTGRAIAYTFTGRGWGHGVGMCQYGAYGLAKIGVKYDEILKHYYTGIDLTKAY